MRLAPLAVLAVAAVALSGCAQFWTGILGDPVAAPDFRVTDTDGRAWNLTDLGGRVVLLDFMGTWCGPCQRSVPVLHDLQDAYPELVVLSITSTDDAGDVADFRARYGADWPHVLDDGRLVAAYREAGSNAPNQVWPSYAIVDQDGMLRFYNRGETLPATFTAALDDITHRQAPAVSAGAVPVLAFAGVLGLLAWGNPFLLRYTWRAEAPRPPASAVVPVVLYGLVGVVAAWYSRPLSGRTATVAPFVAAGAVLAVGYWRMRGSAHVQADGRRLQSASAPRHTMAFWGNTLWYLLPVWAAVLHAAMLRTASVESLLLLVAFGAGLGAGELLARSGRLQRRIASWGERAGWPGALALLVAAGWNGLLWLR